MKTYTEAKDAYIKDHLSKPLKAPNIRLQALENIETALKGKDLHLLEANNLFKKYNETAFLDLYLELKGRRLNSAEKSVIHGLFKFSV